MPIPSSERAAFRALSQATARDWREPFRGHRYFSDTEYFCERYDQNSFDPDYPTLPLAAFEPIVMRFFQGPPPLRTLPLHGMPL